MGFVKRWIKVGGWGLGVGVVRILLENFFSAKRVLGVFLVDGWRWGL